MLVPKGGLEPPRVTSHAPQTCASTSSATSARLEGCQKSAARFLARYFFLVGCGDAVNTVEVGFAAGSAEAVGDACAVGDATGVGAAGSGFADCKTELVP